MRYTISLVLILTVLWLAVSGVYKPPLLILGAGSVALVAWLSRRMHVVGAEHNPALYSWRLPAYWLWLLGQIMLANLHVARRVLDPSGIRPTLVHMPVTLATRVGRVTYGNSVTLTPGTVTLDLGRDSLTAHALDEHSAAGLREGTIARHIAWLECGANRNAES